MSVYHLCITSGGDLVVLLPRSLALLLRELRRQRRDMLLSVETLLPSAFAGYLLRVINSNRQTPAPAFVFPGSLRIPSISRRCIPFSVDSSLRCRSTARPASALCGFAAMRSCSAPATLSQMLRAMRRRCLITILSTDAVCVWR